MTLPTGMQSHVLSMATGSGVPTKFCLKKAKATSQPRGDPSSNQLILPACTTYESLRTKMLDWVFSTQEELAEQSDEEEFGFDNEANSAEHLSMDPHSTSTVGPNPPSFDSSSVFVSAPPVEVPRAPLPPVFKF